VLRRSSCRHDGEEFVGVVRRYGACPDVQALVDAANKPAEGEIEHIEGLRNLSAQVGLL
jgi:hypothetical protein